MFFQTWNPLEHSQSLLLSYISSPGSGMSEVQISTMVPQTLSFHMNHLCQYFILRTLLWVETFDTDPQVIF